MHIHGDPRIECIVLVMHLVDLVERSIVEGAMEAVEDDVFEVVDEEDLQSELSEVREVLEAQLNALPIHQVD
jgi:hypothetical protein